MALFHICTTLLIISFGISQAIPADYSHALENSIEVDSSEHGQFKGSKSTSCKCGWTNKASGRIVGGRDSRVNEYPHMAGLATKYFSRYSVFCGASILTPYHAITAAHCTHDDNDQLYLVVGEHDLYKEYETPHTERYEVKNYIEHPSYNPDTLENDASLLVIKEKIKFSDAVGPICMPTVSMNSLVGDPVKVTGWGTMSYLGIQSSTLLKVNLRVISLNQCAQFYKNIQTDTPTQFCTYGRKKDSCQGDSGGPVTWLDPETNRYTLVGLVSYGKFCATIMPGVNTDVYKFRKWIESTIKMTSPESVNTCSKVD